MQGEKSNQNVISLYEEQLTLLLYYLKGHQVLDTPLSTIGSSFVSCFAYCVFFARVI